MNIGGVDITLSANENYIYVGALPFHRTEAFALSQVLEHFVQTGELLAETDVEELI